MSRTPCRTPAEVAVSVDKHVGRGGITKTHLSNLLQVALGGYPRHLDCNLEATIFALPHVRKPTAGVWYGCWIIGYCDL